MYKKKNKNEKKFSFFLITFIRVYMRVYVCLCAYFFSKIFYNKGIYIFVCLQVIYVYKLCYYELKKKLKFYR